MATLVKTYTTHVSQSVSNLPTCFGLPGSQGGNAAWMPVELDLTLKVYDNYDVYVSAQGTISKDNLLSADYPSILVANASNWEWSYSDGSIVVPSGAGTIASATVVVPGSSRGTYTWNIASGDVYLGKLQSFGGTGSGTDGVVWISGTGTYHVNDPIYPSPVPITVPGFLEYIGYYPWARMIDGDFKSCNREGGRLYRRAGGTWVDRKNTEQGSETDKVFYRTNGAYVKCPKIGSGAL